MKKFSILGLLAVFSVSLGCGPQAVPTGGGKKMEVDASQKKERTSMMGEQPAEAP
jgi:hypothetical protein